MPDGCIYVARNDEINPPNLYKIGKTEFAQPDRRMRELTQETTNWDGKYEAKAWVFVENVDKCEKIIHRALANYRVSKNREFFFVDFNRVIETIKTQLNDFIILGRGKLNEFNIHSVSKKTFKYIVDNKVSSILKLFKFVNNNSMCDELNCWQDTYGFRNSLSIIILNSLKKKISSNLINNPDGLKQMLFKEICFKEFCKQLSYIKDDELYLYNNNIDNIRDQHNFMLSKGSLKPIIIENIFVIFNEARQHYNLKKTLKEMLGYTDIYEAYSNKTKNNLKTSRKEKIKRKEDEIKRKEEKEKKKLENKEKVKKQKISQGLRSVERIKYNINLKKLNLDLRLKRIVLERPFGINGIEENLFEADNEQKFMFNFVKLELREQEKFKKLIKNNSKKIFKKLNKLLKNN